MPFRIFKSFPPDGDCPLAEMSVVRPDGAENPFVIFRRDGTFMITVYERNGKVAWEYPLDDLLDGISAATQALDTTPWPGNQVGPPPVP